uniref:Caspase family p20 domain-containing protein n=1 Tax=Plectus sambesii TaxID=2011161 RepID=A0A914WSK8_9BILA
MARGMTVAEGPGMKERFLKCLDMISYGKNYGKYDFDGSKCHVLIIDNYEFEKASGFEKLQSREGHVTDMEELDTLLTHLKIKNKEPFITSNKIKNVKYYENLSAKAMKGNIQAFFSSLNHPNIGEIDASMVFIFTHGDKGDLICGVDVHKEGGLPYDEKLVHLSEIFDIFNLSVCDKLMEKPKLFFIEACRGGKSLIPHAMTGSPIPQKLQDQSQTIIPVTRYTSLIDDINAEKCFNGGFAMYTV